jgi:hypothetical protein
MPDYVILAFILLLALAALVRVECILTAGLDGKTGNSGQMETSGYISP